MDYNKLFKTVKAVEAILNEDVLLTPAYADSKYDSTKLTTRAGDEFEGLKFEKGMPKAGNPFPSLCEKIGMVESTEHTTKDMDSKGYFPDTVFTYEDVSGVPGLGLICSYNMFRKKEKICTDPKKGYNPDKSSKKKVYALVSSDGKKCGIFELSEGHEGGYLNAADREKTAARNKSKSNKDEVN